MSTKCARAKQRNEEKNGRGDKKTKEKAGNAKKSITLELELKT